MDSDFDDNLNDFRESFKGERWITDDGQLQLRYCVIFCGKNCICSNASFFENREEGNFQNYKSELFHLLLASSQKFSLWQIAINHFQAYDSFSTIIFSNLLIIKSRNSHGKNNGLEAVNKQKMFPIEQWGKPFEIFFVECCYAAYSSLWNPQLFFQTSLHIAMKWNFPLFSSMFDQWKCW